MKPNNEDQKYLEILFNKYLHGNGCSEIFYLKNKYSRVDAIIMSASTQVVTEYKRRMNSITQYETCILERSKYQSLIEASRLLNAPAFFICDFDDCILIYDIKENSDLLFENIPAPFSSTDDTSILKEVVFLKYENADFIISKRDYKRKLIHDLKGYIEFKKVESQKVIEEIYTELNKQ